MRTIGWIFTAILIFLVVIGSIWRTAYDWEYRLPDEVEVAGLTSPVEIQWGEFNIAEIQGSSLSDALFGLGYVQGKLNGWTIALWRQAALGKLSDWYGPEVVEADQVIRLLGLPENAQRAEEYLSPDELGLITAFGKGIQHAWLDTDQVHEFFFQNITPEPWEPWHTLAIERFIAWMSNVPESVCALGELICTDNAILDSMVYLHGMESSHAWVLPTSEHPLLYQRHILGQAVGPVFQEVILKVDHDFVLQGASLIGTPFFPAGKMGNRVWSILLNSPKTVRPTRYGPIYPLRFRFSDHEEIVYYHRSDSSFSIRGAQEELLWPGLGSQNDVQAWFSLLNNQPAQFNIWRGDGILISTDNSWTVSGNPEFLFPISPSGFVISNDSSAIHSAFYLSNLKLNESDPSEWVTDTWSPWAASTLPSHLDSLRIPPSAPTQVHSALAYLENWNHTFTGNSIGATIYHEWMISEGEPPEEAFARAVDRLEQKLGVDQNQWLWERVHDDRRHFTLHGYKKSRKYSPTKSPLIGHESTMLWGGTNAAAAPVTWESWTWSDPSSPYFIRKKTLKRYQPFGRYIFEMSEPSIFPLLDSYQNTTVLLPDDL